MFPTSFCDRVVRKYSSEGETILDPFAGRGTAIFSGAAAGRLGLGVEVNPVGWVYARAKLSPASRERVEQRVAGLGSASYRFEIMARRMPRFFRRCFSLEVRKFLLCARASLNWRQDVVDRTLMALMLVHLHGKRTDSFSNQMRQTKAMSPKYALRWWRENRSAPPDLDPVEFMRGKLRWRYAKGTPERSGSKVFLGNSLKTLSALRGRLRSHGFNRPSLLLTSPPYLGVTNYHYDQWLRLWLLGGPPTDRRKATRYSGRYRGRFVDRDSYRELLSGVFQRCASLVRADAVVYVRTDRREQTLTITREALSEAFPRHSMRELGRPVRGETQTRLFGNGDPRVGEVDLVLTR